LALVAVACGAGGVALRSSGTSQAFDGAAAFARLKEQCDFGPRVPGTTGHTRCLDYLVKSLQATTTDVARQEFTFDDNGKPLRMTNVVAKYAGGSAPATLLCAHWDTRPTADMESDPARRKQPILGANDGASGVAVLLELARMLQRRPPPGPVWIVLFDGEDLGPDVDRMFLGSRHFADTLAADTPRQGVLLDMIGDRDLAIYHEGNSLVGAREVVDAVWAVAKRLGHERYFIPRERHTISDDHIPLMAKGLAVADLIDFDYPPWHTLGDTVDKCSSESLKVVGSVVAAWVYGRGG
jgi:Zn-dependent M28 family amino/carboxypeptidase